MKYCILASLGAQTFQGKYIDKKSNWKPFWDLALFHKGIPIDVVDYYNLQRSPKDFAPNSNRHIYTNGILIYNRLSKLVQDITLFNSLEQHENIFKYDVIIISTNYVSTNWEDNLIALLSQLRERKKKVILGGVGIYKLYQAGHCKYKKIRQLVSGFIILSTNGLSLLEYAAVNIRFDMDSVKELTGDEIYEMKQDDFSLSKLPLQFHSKHSTLLTQTGCCYNCAFCSYKERSEDHRFFELSTVMNALKNMCETNRNGLLHLRIVDEAFNTNTQRAIQFCNYIIEQGIQVKWSCFLRIDKVTLELANALKRAGCDFVSIGIESGSQKMQKIMNKNLDLQKAKDNIRILQSLGIVVNTSLLVGFFGEDFQTVQETIDYINDVKPDLARINVWSPSKKQPNKLYAEYNFAFDDMLNTWTHDTTNESEAIKFSVQIYKSSSETAILPPFTSIFDQWPVLVSYGLTSEQIVRLFRNYYRETLQNR